MWSVDIRTSAAGVEAGTPVLLFKGRQVRRQEPPGRAYDVSADDSRFFMFRDTQERADEIKVIFNFFELLKAKVP